jgi:hypothetical protein
MKKIKEFEDQKLSLSSLKSIVGGESCCTHIEDTSEGTCWDELRETYYDDG